MIVKLRNECLAYGPITHAVCTFYKRYLRPNTAAVDHMMNDGVHVIDTLRWMCGGEVAEIQSLSKRASVPDLNFTTALIRFDNGAVGVMLHSLASGRRTFRVEMHAPGICAEAEHEGKGYLYVDGDSGGIEFDTRQVAESDQAYVYGGFRAKNREFIDGVRAGTLPASNFADAVKTMDVAERILAAATLRAS